MPTQKKKFYAVAKGRKTGVYHQWFGPESAESAVKKFPGARYKGFTTLAAAQKWLAQGSGKTEYKDRSVGREKKAAQKLSEIPSVTIYTDGGARRNPGPGGYGTVLICGERRREFSGGFRRTTNNRMELMACIVALSALKCVCVATIHSDSRYVVDGITKGWARRWKARGWVKSDGNVPENVDLWQQLLDLCEKHRVEFRWVKGHAGVPENERCDQLAVQSASKTGLPADSAYENGETRNTEFGGQ
jgi:ribonuclease HI